MTNHRLLAAVSIGCLAAFAQARAPLPQGSDSCATAGIIVGSGSFAFDTTAATTGLEGQNEANCSFFGTTAIDQDVWFDWRADSTGTATFDTCSGTALDTKLALWPGGGCPADGSSLACNDDSCSLQSSISLSVVAGNSYLIQLGSFPGSGGGTGTLTINIGPPPITIPAGSDFWNTPGLGCTYQDFTATPIPAGFFGSGSLPFTGYVGFVGQPLTGTGLVGGVDTIVERLSNASIPSCGGMDTVPLRIAALSLKSFVPITVQFGSGTSKYNVAACLSSTFAQPVGSMTIRWEHLSGGTFDSTVPVIPRMVFTRVGGGPGVASATLDAGGSITFQNPPTASGVPACWSFTDGGLGIPGSPGGNVDHDCNVSTANVPYPPTSANFVGGVCFPGASCAFAGGPAEARLSEEATVLARHCILPVSLPPTTVGYCYCPPSQPPYPPCGNPDPIAGCANSTGSGGNLTYSGVADVSADTLSLIASGLAPFQPGLLFQGPMPGLGVFGDGHLCVTGSLRRMGVISSNSGGVITFGFPSSSIAVQGNLPATGGLRYYQVWYRDPLGPCGFGYNLTNALQINWVP